MKHYIVLYGIVLIVLCQGCDPPNSMSSQYHISTDLDIKEKLNETDKINEIIKTVANDLGLEIKEMPIVLWVHTDSVSKTCYHQTDSEGYIQTDIVIRIDNLFIIELNGFGKLAHPNDFQDFEKTLEIELKKYYGKNCKIVTKREEWINLNVGFYPKECF